MIPRSRAAAALALTAAAAALGTCGGGSSSPTAPLPPVTSPAGPASPAAPDVYPGAASCGRMGLGSPAYDCRDEAAAFQAQVQAAIDALRRDQPDLFDTNALGLHVTSPGRFYVGLIERLDRMGLCAAFDGHELAVKSSNDFNDQYQVLTSTWNVRQFGSSYQVTCYPAAFPSAAPGHPPANAACRLPSSREVACAPEGARFFADVDGSIAEVARRTPQVFDQADQATEGGYRIVDPDGWKRGLVEAMAARGYCARHDGEEFVFKKGTNTLSEHYDLESSQGYVRRGEGTYVSTCYPAAF